MAFIRSRRLPSIPDLLRLFIRSECCILSKAFSELIEMMECLNFFFFFLSFKTGHLQKKKKLWWSALMVKLALYFWNKPDLAVMYYFLNILLFLFFQYLFRIFSFVFLRGFGLYSSFLPISFSGVAISDADLFEGDWKYSFSNSV